LALVALQVLWLGQIVYLILLQRQAAAQVAQHLTLLGAMVHLAAVVVQEHQYRRVEQEFLGKDLLAVQDQIISVAQAAVAEAVLGLSEGLQHSQVMLLVPAAQGRLHL
jgi:hypothetical protein